MGKSRYPSISAEAFDKLFEELKNWGKWGYDDQRGTLNYITPEKMAAAAALVKTGRSVSLAMPISKTSGPDNPVPALHYMVKTHESTAADTGRAAKSGVSPNAGCTAESGVSPDAGCTAESGVSPDAGCTAESGVSPDACCAAESGFSADVGFAADFLGIQYHGDCFSHIDALCHVSYKRRLYNGIPASSVGLSGSASLNVTAYANGIVGRGVLIDVPKYRGVKWLEPGEAVTGEEIEAIEKSQGTRLGEGDILALRTGQYRRRQELGAWDVSGAGEGRAGIDPYSLLLLRDRKVAAFMPEGDGEVIPSYVEGIRCPIHPLQIAAMGMACADSLQMEELSAVCEEEKRYEFMMVIAPLRLPNATGSPVNPIAVF